MLQLLKNIRIIHSKGENHMDMLIENGKIKTLDKTGSISEQGIKKNTNSNPYFWIPSGIDPHVHLKLKTPAGFSSDDFESGSLAALRGHTKHLIDFVTPRRRQPLTEALKERQAEVDVCHTSLRFHIGISGWLEDMEKQMEICVNELGAVSFKAYLAYRNNIGIDYPELEKIMRIAAKLNALVLVHAEEDDIIENNRRNFIAQGKTHHRYHALSRPPETESKAVQKVIELVRKTSCHTYLVHISAAESADAIRMAKNEGLPLYAETCPQYLLYDESVYEKSFEEAAPFIFSPPARAPIHKEALWKHVLEGTFDTIATDHCPFTMAQKKLGLHDFTKIPNGGSGIESRISNMYKHGVQERGMSLQQWVSLCCTRAAEIFKIDKPDEPQVGAPFDYLEWK